MPFEIIRSDITEVKADAIVNTANPFPVIGAGTEAAIYEKAGPQLLEERRKIGYIEPGESFETSAFDLDAKYILHTVTTDWIDGKHGEELVLRKAYDSALVLAEKLGCESVAFPLMAAGSCGFPPEVALGTAVKVLTEHLLMHDIKVLLVVFSREAFSLAGSLFDDVRSFVDDNYVQARSEEERGYAGASRKDRKKRKESELFNAAREKEGLNEVQYNAFVSSGASYAAESAFVAEDLEALLRERESTFVEYLRDVIREKEVTDPELYRRAGMSRQLFNKIINDKEYRPTKKTAIQLAVGLQMNMDETQKLLGKAGYALTRSSKQDIIVEYFIRKGAFDLLSIDLALADAGLPTIVKIS